MHLNHVNGIETTKSVLQIDEQERNCAKRVNGWMQFATDVACLMLGVEREKEGEQPKERRASTDFLNPISLCIYAYLHLCTTHPPKNDTGRHEKIKPTNFQSIDTMCNAYVKCLVCGMHMVHE